METVTVVFEVIMKSRSRADIIIVVKHAALVKHGLAGIINHHFMIHLPLIIDTTNASNHIALRVRHTHIHIGGQLNIALHVFLLLAVELYRLGHFDVQTSRGVVIEVLLALSRALTDRG